ncbi:MAG: hypothetical protein JJD98_07325 [Polaromonas sp.]|nr:hypothetical protein [Polaromonas sp.]
MIEAVHGEGDVLGGDGIEVHFLWKVLTNKPVGLYASQACMEMSRFKIDKSDIRVWHIGSSYQTYVGKS